MIIYVLSNLLRSGAFSRSSSDRSKKQDERSHTSSFTKMFLDNSLFSSFVKWFLRTRFGKWFIAQVIKLVYKWSTYGKPKDTFTVLSTGKAAKITYWRQGVECFLYVPLRSNFSVDERILYGQKIIDGKVVNTLIGKVDDVVWCITPGQLGYDTIMVCDSDKTVLGVSRCTHIVNPLLKKVSFHDERGELYDLSSFIGPVEYLPTHFDPKHNIWFDIGCHPHITRQGILNLNEIFVY